MAVNYSIDFQFEDKRRIVSVLPKEAEEPAQNLALAFQERFEFVPQRLGYTIGNNPGDTPKSEMVKIKISRGFFEIEKITDVSNASHRESFSWKINPLGQALRFDHKDEDNSINKTAVFAEAEKSFDAFTLPHIAMQAVIQGKHRLTDYQYAKRMAEDKKDNNKAKHVVSENQARLIGRMHDDTLTTPALLYKAFVELKADMLTMTKPTRRRNGLELS